MRETNGGACRWDTPALRAELGAVVRALPLYSGEGDYKDVIAFRSHALAWELEDNHRKLLRLASKFHLLSGGDTPRHTRDMLAVAGQW